MAGGGKTKQRTDRLGVIVRVTPIALATALIIVGLAFEFGGAPVAVIFGTTYVVLGAVIAVRVRRMRRARAESGVPVSAQERATAVSSVRRSLVTGLITAPAIAAILLIYRGVTGGTVLASAGLVLMAAISARDLRRARFV
jgi:hypothetical protein